MKTVKEALCGNVMRVVVYTRGSRWDSDAARRVKREWREKAWKAVNFRNSRQKLEERISCNFTESDYHIILTLSDKFNTTDYKRMRGYYRAFIKKLRQKRKRRGAEPPTYIYVMEGLHGDRRLHIHLLMKEECLDWAELVECWVYGEIHHTSIRDCEHMEQLGRYLTKEPAKNGRFKNDINIFVASHNCVKPTVKSYKLQDMDEYICPDGFKVVHSEQIQNDFGCYTYYELIATPSCNTQ